MEEPTHRLMPRCRFGIINPRSEGGLQVGPGYQFYRIVPNDVMQVPAVLGLEGYSPAAVEKAMANYWPCVEFLVREKANMIILGGFPISAQLGRPKVLKLLRQTEDKTGLPCDSAMEAVIAGLKYLGLTKAAVGSRWGKEVNDAVIRYFDHGGIRVVGITRRDQSPAEAAAMSFDEGLKIALHVGREAAKSAPQAEAVVVPGAAAMTLHVIPALEEEYGKATLTNLSAEVWNNLIRPGIIPPVDGWGCLLAGRRWKSQQGS